MEGLGLWVARYPNPILVIARNGGPVGVVLRLLVRTESRGYGERSEEVSGAECVNVQLYVAQH
eukprot:1051411-Amorphochlora_amoeboformis.AAC.1